MADKMRDRNKSNTYHDDYYDAMHKDNLQMQEYILNPIVFSEINNVNNLYYNQAMKAPDAREFQRSIIK